MPSACSFTARPVGPRFLLLWLLFFAPFTWTSCVDLLAVKRAGVLPTTTSLFLFSPLGKDAQGLSLRRIWRGLDRKGLVPVGSPNTTFCILCGKRLVLAAEGRPHKFLTSSVSFSFLLALSAFSFPLLSLLKRFPFFFRGSGGSRELSGSISPLSFSLGFHRISELSGKDPLSLRLLGLILGPRGIQMITFIHHWN